MNKDQIVQKLWSFCNLLRDDGLSYGDYVEQLTFLLFLKMADERTRPPFLTLKPLPRTHSWQSLLSKSQTQILPHYEAVLRNLGGREDLFGAVFHKAQSRFRDAAKFHKLVHALIDREEWSRYDTDVKGEAYEGLIEKSATEGKAGAGQYFTPRALVRSMVEVINPRVGTVKRPFTICDPACGTGGFLVAAHEFIRNQSASAGQLKYLNSRQLNGVELVDSVARLCVMNLVLHGIGGARSPISVTDALVQKHGEYDLVLANPPFGKKSSVTIVNDAGESSKESLIINRDDFWASTSNKQLNFLQHIFTILKQHGRAAVVLPDNVLFEGGAGETIRRELLKQADVHTLLRLPTGIFYAQGVKANVLFFDRKPAQEKPWTQRLWMYDLRTNMHFTLKENPLKRSDLDDFVGCYFGRPGSAVSAGEGSRHHRVETERFKSFSYDDLMKRDKVNLDIFWLKDEAMEESANLPAPEIIAADIAADLEAALEQFATIAEDLKGE